MSLTVMPALILPGVAVVLAGALLSLIGAAVAYSGNDLMAGVVKTVAAVPVCVGTVLILLGVEPWLLLPFVVAIAAVLFWPRSSASHRSAR